MKNVTENSQQANTTLVVGGTGKTGRRVVERLKTRGIPVRIGSRAGEPPFDWEDPTTWEAVLQGMANAYVTFYPDLAIPGSVDAIRTFTDLAVQNGVQRLVLLSGRGEEEALRCEEIVQQSSIEWTILRATFFSQNFSEGFLVSFLGWLTIWLTLFRISESIWADCRCPERTEVSDFRSFSPF